MARKLTKKNTKVQKVIKRVRPANEKVNAAGVALIPAPQGQYVEAVGRRKVATARVRLYSQTGDMLANGKAMGNYFSTVPNAATLYNRPFVLTNTKNQFAVSAKVSGSGASAQLRAVVHGIARALVMMNAEYRAPLKEAGLLTRDDRMKESRKIGMGGKARRKRQSPKR